MHEHMPEWARYLSGLLAVALGVLGALHVRGRPARPRGWERAASAALVAASVLYLAYLGGELVPALWARAARRDDMVRYYVIAGRALRGQALYWPWPDYGPHFATPGHPYPQPRYPYPPFLMGVLVPFAHLPLLTFARMWYVVLYAGLAVYAASLAKLATGRVTLAGATVATAVVAATPGAQLAFMVANVEPVLWALFGAALAWPAARGFGFAASAMVKLYCAWPLLAAVPREGWRVVRGAALALALGTVLCMLVLGPGVFARSMLDWARYMLPVVGQGTWAFDPHYGGTNVSFSFAVLRVARELGWEYRPGPLPAWARLYLTVVGVAAPLLAMWLTRRMRDVALRCGLVTVAAVLFAPLCWATYLPLLLAPLAAAVRLRAEYGAWACAFLPTDYRESERSALPLIRRST
jgi:hypothetical protein